MPHQRHMRVQCPEKVCAKTSCDANAQVNLQGESYHRQMYLPVRAITPDARFRSFQCRLDIAPGEDLQWKREVVFYSFLVIRVGQNLVQAAKQPKRGQLSASPLSFHVSLGLSLNRRSHHETPRRSERSRFSANCDERSTQKLRLFTSHVSHCPFYVQVQSQNGLFVTRQKTCTVPLRTVLTVQLVS